MPKIAYFFYCNIFCKSYIAYNIVFYIKNSLNHLISRVKVINLTYLSNRLDFLSTLQIREKPNNKLFNVGFQKTNLENIDNQVMMFFALKLETAYSLRIYFAVLLIKSTSY